MAAEKGSAFLLKVGDGAEPPVYATVAGLRIGNGRDRAAGHPRTVAASDLHHSMTPEEKMR